MRGHLTSCGTKKSRNGKSIVCSSTISLITLGSYIIDLEEVLEREKEPEIPKDRTLFAWWGLSR